MDEMKTLTINGITYEIVDETARAQISNKQDRLDVPSWVASALPSNTAWHTVAYGNGMYVAITNDSNKTAYSTDGINWTETANLPSESDWRSIVYGDGKFVAIAYGTAGAYSTDGINWTPITFPVSRNRSSVTYGNGTFVAICSSSDAVSYSTDGINWSESTLPSAGSWQSVTYGNGVFVAVVNSSNAAAYSTDGITWTATTLPSNTRWRSVAYGNGMFVAVATNVNTAAYSTDGINWSETTLPTKASWYSVIYGNGMFMAVAYNSAVSMYSIDGINWTEAELPYKTYWYSVAYGPVGFVAIGFSSDKAAYAKTTEVFAARIDSDAIPVTSVNGKTGAVQLNADDVGAAPVTHEHSAEDITSGAFNENVLPTVPVTKGGTGATDATTARTNLEITPANIGAVQSVATYITANTYPDFDLDTATDSLYLIQKGFSKNCPINATNIFVRQLFFARVGPDSSRIQIAYAYPASNGAIPDNCIAIRGFYKGGAWSEWKQFADTNYALNKAGDTMTGHLTLNGDYKRITFTDSTSRTAFLEKSASDTGNIGIYNSSGDNRSALILNYETAAEKDLLLLTTKIGSESKTRNVLHTGNKSLITPADIGAVNQAGDRMAGNLTIENNNVPTFIVQTPNQGLGKISKDANDTVDYGTIVQDISKDNNKVQLVVLGKNASTPQNALRLYVSPAGGADSSFNILHTGNVTAGTTDITAGTTALETGCYYDVYK